MDPTEEEEELGLRVVMQLPDHVQEELRDINKQIQHGDENRQRLVSMNGYCFDKQGRIVVGPTTTQHLMHVLHRTAAGHLGSYILLAKFRDKKIAEETIRTCAGCQQGTDYRPGQPPMGHIIAEKS